MHLVEPNERWRSGSKSKLEVKGDMRTPVHWKRNVTMIIRHGLSQVVTAIKSDSATASLDPTQRQVARARFSVLTESLLDIYEVCRIAIPN